VDRFPAEAAPAIYDERLIVRSQLWARADAPHEQLDAIATRDGARLWRTWLPGEAKYHLEPPLRHGDHLYTTTRDGAAGGQLYRIRLVDGHTTRTAVPTAGAPFAARGDVLHLGGWPPIAYDARAQRVVWRATLGYVGEPDVTVLAGGTLDAARGVAYLGDSQRHVYAVDAATGALERRIRVDGYARFELGSPVKALFGSYGVRRLDARADRLFVGTVDGSLFVFGGVAPQRPSTSPK
jgi:outer membrane protein assembly factor BamB